MTTFKIPQNTESTRPFTIKFEMTVEVNWVGPVGPGGPTHFRSLNPEPR